MSFLTDNLNTTVKPLLMNDGASRPVLNNSDCKTWSFMNPNETIEIAYMISRAIVGVAAMIGNLLIVLSVIRFNYLKKASAYYLCNMALADFLLGLVGATYPFRVSYFSKTNQITRTLSFMVHNFAVLHSMCSMVIVAADRFSFICFPLTYEMNIFATTPYLFIVISIVWTIALISTLTYLFVWHDHIMMKIGSFFDLVYFLVAMLALFILYGAIMKVACAQQAKDKKQREAFEALAKSSANVTAALSQSSAPVNNQAPPRNNESNRQMRVIIGYIFIVATFCCTYVYANAMMHVRSRLDYCEMGFSNTSFFYCFLYSSIVLQNFNAVCNPIVYSYCLSHFRQAFKRNIVEIFTCCRSDGSQTQSEARTSILLDVPDESKTSKKRSTGGSASMMINGSQSQNGYSPVKLVTSSCM